ncbi:MAG: hypothetical protein HQ472_11140 [Ignavibacteria bacterium]|nr:hypothetical protein [Ignavibacteria bacterium]
MNNFLFVIVTLITSSAVTSNLFAQNADVNAERVSFDYQMLRAISGKSSVGSVSVWPQSVYTIKDQSTDTSSAFSKYVSDYYAPIMLDNNSSTPITMAENSFGRFRGLVYSDSGVRLQGDASLMARAGYYNTTTVADPFVLFRPAVRFMGSLNSNLGFFLDLSNGMRIKGNPRYIALTDPTLARTLKFNTEDSSFFDRYIGYVQYQSEHLRIRFGREAMQFGFSPIDNFVHSIDAALLDGLLIDVPYKSIRFTMTHSGANGTDTTGAAVPTKYIATHRLSVDPTPWLSVSVSDMIVYWGRGLDLAYLNPLAFFVSAGLATEERSRNDNSFIGFDAAVRPMNGTMIYGNLIIDDLSYSTLSDTSYVGNNNKFAWQLGASQLLGSTHGNSKPTLISAEYVRIDPYTFSHRTQAASYTSFNAPIGYDMNPNSDRLAVQLKTWFTPRTFLRADFDYTRHGENILGTNGKILMGEDPRYPGSGLQAPIGNVGGDALRGDGDFLQGNRFLRGVLSYQRRVRIWFSAEWLPNVFTDLRIGYTHRSGGNTPSEFFFGGLEVRIGY